MAKHDYKIADIEDARLCKSEILLHKNIYANYSIQANMAKKTYMVEVKLRYIGLFRAILFLMRVLPRSWAMAIVNYKPFINLFIYVEKGK